jgi:leucyl aminopeptidase
MPSVVNAFSTRCLAAPLPLVDTDVVVVPWFEGEGVGAFEALDRASGGEISRALATTEFSGRLFDLFVTPIVEPAWHARRVVIIGAGKSGAFNSGVLRQVAAAAALAGRRWHASRFGFVVRGQAADWSDVDDLAQAVAEGLTLSEFNGGSYKTVEPPPSAPPEFVVVLPDAGLPPAVMARCDAAVMKGRILGECSNGARGLANEPGNTLTPREFAARAADLAGGAGIGVEILDERRTEALGMGMLMGVARGSSEPPRLMVFRYEPPDAPKGPVLGLVGKGVTFDTGGISIKPADGMERMKDDMAGGAAVAAAMRAIGKLGAPIRVVGVVPATENMPGGRAVKPGDILKSAEGKTVEVINTDAEGRLILGDALWYARQLGATHLVDVATLTGAIVVALGKVASGIFGTPDAWVRHICGVGERAGDRMWQLPLFDEYREQLKSEIADFTNTGGRPAGSSTAAMFLKEFTGDLPWAHIDIAGTAWADDAKPYLPKGPSGVAVRTLAELAIGARAWPV